MLNNNLKEAEERRQITEAIINKSGFITKLLNKNDIYVKIFDNGKIDEAIVFKMGKKYLIEKRGSTRMEKYEAPEYEKSMYNFAEGWVTIYRASQISSGIMVSLPERFIDLQMLKEAGFLYSKTRRVFSRVGSRYFQYEEI